MGKRYLIDTNTVIDYLDYKIPETGIEFMNVVIDNDPNILIITND